MSRMGRSLPVPVPCQVCGDKSFGRHYGIYCCDGCSCFFKRSIRKKITYTCISGDDNCAIDKARRNWCPACRLLKCFKVNMNKNAVQKERGPRKLKFSTGSAKRPSSLGQADTCRDTPPQTGSGVATALSLAESSASPTVDKLLRDFCGRTLLKALRECLGGPMLKVSDAATKLGVITDNWPPVFLLHLSVFHADTAQRVFAADQQRILEICTFAELLNLDLQELHIVSSLVICTRTTSFSLTTKLMFQELYRSIMMQHCANAHPGDLARTRNVQCLSVSLAQVTETRLAAAFDDDALFQAVRGAVESLSGLPPSPTSRPNRRFRSTREVLTERAPKIARVIMR